jgi:hypothetical protein
MPEDEVLELLWPPLLLLLVLPPLLLLLVLPPLLLLLVLPPPVLLLVLPPPVLLLVLPPPVLLLVLPPPVLLLVLPPPVLLLVLLPLLPPVELPSTTTAVASLPPPQPVSSSIARESAPYRAILVMKLIPRTRQRSARAVLMGSLYLAPSEPARYASAVLN